MCCVCSTKKNPCVFVYRQQLKAQISMYREGGDALLFDLGEQALGSEEILTTADLLSYVDGINSTDVTNVSVQGSICVDFE